MSWLSSLTHSLIDPVLKAVGLMPDAPSAPSPGAPAPTVDNSYQQMDAQSQQQAAAVSRGRTSTQLTGSQGETEDQKYTSKVLLGQ